MKTPSPPPAPNPRDTADTQGRLNRQNAIAQQELNMVDQTNPFGALRYSQAGTNPDGTPRYQATTSFSPQTQQLFDTNMGTANTLARQIAQRSSQPFNLDNEVTESRLMELGSRRLQPQLQRDWQAQEADLLNRGITMGSEAYRGAREQFDQRQNDAWNQLALTGRQQAVNELLTERQLPYQELAALMGAVPQMPQFASTPQAQISAPDYQGAAAQAHNADLQAWQQQSQNRNALLGGLFGLGNTLLAGWGRQGFPGVR